MGGGGRGTVYSIVSSHGGEDYVSVISALLAPTIVPGIKLILNQHLLN